MALISALLGDRRAQSWTGASPRNPAYWLEQLMGGSGTATGQRVTQESSMQLVAVFACVRILADTIGTLPLRIYRRMDRGKLIDRSHPVYALLHDQPNPEMTAANLREAITGHVELWGNAYLEIEFDNAMRRRALWPLRPDRMRVTREDGELVYHYRRPDGRETDLEAWRVLHFRGLSPDGLVGYSPIALAREAVGLGLALEEFGSRYFGNAARPGGVLTHPGHLTEAGRKNLRDSWEALHGGLQNAHRVAILEEGISWQSLGIPPDDSQFIEGRKFQTTEIARLFRVPPHMLADLERATFSNIEHQSIDFVVHTIRPRLVRLEQEINRQLRLGPTHFAEHAIEGLLRGDVQSRYAAYATGRQWGWLSANDIRETENLNPIEGGDSYLTPLNMVPAGQPAAQEVNNASGD